MLSHPDKKKNPVSPIKIDCAVFSAMPEELSELERVFSSCPVVCHEHQNLIFRIYDINGFRLLLTPTGIGTVFAGSIITLVHSLFRMDCMLFIGTAGAIHDALKIRDIILVESAFEAESQSMFSALKDTPFESCLTHPLTKEALRPVYAADPDLIALAESSIDLPIIRGPVVSSNSFPSPKELFPDLKKDGVLSIDMETSAFYQMAWLLGIPSLAVRAVSNQLDHQGDDEHVAESDVAGSIRVASEYVIKLIHVLAKQHPNEQNVSSSISSVTV
ncbi:5'-methylthioadenosine/S-adenosylhomocysteine nucleosidase [Legionella sp. CNM-4043-24]|uniref:5'-methylthioadenosine/S-adenosylhomocysteine nucleosidase n=1 Tax=Legionella sp. CNM-4043-24 TaxID=3421646 RepID=UPI00403B1E6A